tara:strand:- start:220 stop:390 length:171 start_codon:yes stop_codon:yes gene_type:complete
MQLKKLTLAQKLAQSMTKNGRMSAKDKEKLCQKLGMDTQGVSFTVKRGTTTYLQRK